MIVCTKCGLHNDPSDSFCGSCGSFLEWTGTKVDEPAPAPATNPQPVAREQPTVPEEPTLIGRVRDAVGLSAHPGGPLADAAGTAAAEAAAAPTAAAEAAAAETAMAAASAAPTPIVVSGPKVFHIVDDLPEPQPEPVAPEPESAPAPESEPEPEETAAPEPAPTAAAEPAPESTVAPEPAPEPGPEPTAVPEPTAAPEPEPEPTAASELEPAPESTVAPEPGPTVAPAPEPTAAAELEPAPEPTVAPEPSVAPEPEPAPEPTVAPAPEPTVAPEPTSAGPTCPACGRANPAGRVFCISCGERLPAAAGSPAPAPATGAPVLLPPPPRVEPRIRPMLPGAAATSKPRSLVQPSRPVEPPPPVPATPAGATPPATLAQPPAQRPGPSQPPARLPGVAAAGAAAASPPSAAVSAGAPIAPPSPAPPVPPDQPAARRPEAVKPGPERPHPGPRPAQEATPAPNPGDLVCGNCAMGNDPARKFCRRCGQSLATATLAATDRVPWYRRIFGGGKPRTKVAAGERPKSMRTDGKTGGGIKVGRLLSAGIQVVLIAGIIGIVAGYALVPNWQKAVNGFIGSVKEMISPSADQVYTSGPTSGLGSKEHPARFAFDRTLGFWAAPFADGSPPTIQGSFTPPASVAKILVTSGAAGDQYKAFARPRDVTLEFLDAAGTVIVSKSYELKDQAEPQPFDVGAKGATLVRLTVRSVFPAEKANAPVAISEVEFFGSQEGSSPTPAP